MGHNLSSCPLTRISFSPNGKYCAVADSEHVISILHQEFVAKKTQDVDIAYFGGAKNKAKDDLRSADNAVKERMEWIIYGRAKSHFKDIVGIIILI